MNNNSVFKELQNKFNKDVYNLNCKLIDNEDDYYKGKWETSNLFLKNLCNLDLIKEDYEFIHMILLLQSIGCVSASISKFSKNTIVYTHTDEDLINSKDIIRMIIPLEEDSTYSFSGTYIEDKQIVTKDNVVLNEPTLFLPYQEHSFRNISDKSLYFILADITNKKELDSKFWDNYLKFSIGRYI